MLENIKYDGKSIPIILSRKAPSHKANEPFVGIWSVKKKLQEVGCANKKQMVNSKNWYIFRKRAINYGLIPSQGVSVIGIQGGGIRFIAIVVIVLVLCCKPPRAPQRHHAATQCVCFSHRKNSTISTTARQLCCVFRVPFLWLFPLFCVMSSRSVVCPRFEHSWQLAPHTLFPITLYLQISLRWVVPVKLRSGKLENNIIKHCFYILVYISAQSILSS